MDVEQVVARLQMMAVDVGVGSTILLADSVAMKKLAEKGGCQ